MALRLEDLQAEAAAQGFSASYEGRSYSVFLTDQLGRFIIIGTANGPIGADVYGSEQAWQQGESPKASADLQGESIGALLADALNLAARVTPDFAPEPLFDMDGGYYHAPDGDGEDQ